MASLHRVSCAELGLFRAVLRRQHRPAPYLAPAALRRAVGQLCAVRDCNGGRSHDDVAIGTHGSLPEKDHFFAATLGSDVSPVALFLAVNPGFELFFRFKESNGRARLVGPPGDPALDKRHCGLARRVFLFAVLNPYVLGQFYEGVFQNRKVQSSVTKASTSRRSTGSLPWITSQTSRSSTSA